MGLKIANPTFSTPFKYAASANPYRQVKTPAYQDDAFKIDLLRPKTVTPPGYIGLEDSLAAQKEAGQTQSARIRSSLAKIGKLLRSDEEIKSTATPESSDTKLDSLKDSLTFSLKTTEGDLVDVTIDFNPKPEKSDKPEEETTPFSLSVKGNLSVDERKALANLVTEIGSISDALLNGTGELNLDALSAFDSHTLTEFDFSLAANSRSLALNYTVDTKDEHQQLDLNFNNGLNKAAFKIGSAFGASNQEDAEQYLRTINEGASAAYQGSLSAQGKLIKQVFREGLQTIFDLAGRFDSAVKKAESVFEDPREVAKNIFKASLQADTRYKGLSQAGKSVLDQGVANVVDFSASFTADQGGGVAEKAPNENRAPKVKKGFQLDVSQETKTSEPGDALSLSQVRKYHLSASYSGEGKVQITNESEKASFSLNTTKDGTVVSQSLEQTKDNYSRSYAGNGEAIKKVENTAQKDVSNAIISPRKFIEQNISERRGYSFLGIVAYNDLLAGGYKNEDKQKQSSVHGTIDVRV